MKLKCVRADDYGYYEVDSVYEVNSKGSTSCHYNVPTGNDFWFVDKETLDAPGVGHLIDPKFEIVEDSVATEEELCSQFCDKPITPQRVMQSMRRSAIEDIQTQCSRANLSISIDPEGFNIFDCDTDMQTMVESVADAIEILETKIEYKDSMGKWGWL